jgi:hypothetical protein
LETFWFAVWTEEPTKEIELEVKYIFWKYLKFDQFERLNQYKKKKIKENLNEDYDKSMTSLIDY